MIKKILPGMAFLTLVFMTVGIAVSPAEEIEEESSPQTKMSLAMQPLRYSFVKGDERKFREQKWQREGYGGGIDEFTMDAEGLPEDVQIHLDGRAIVIDDDYKSVAKISKEGLGFLGLEFQQFTKYYDPSGGVFYPNTVFKAPTLDRDLSLKVGHFIVETGLRLEDFPNVTFTYEREYKYGSKSRLSWVSATESGQTRNIAPAWQDIKEDVHVFELEADHTVRGIEIAGKQRFELNGARLSREEPALSTTGGSGKKIRLQTQEPQARLVSTTGSLQKWSREDSLFTGAAYHFLHINNQEVENIFEMNEARVVTNFSNPKQIRGARADNTYNSHAWVLDALFTPVKWLSIIPKLKSEVIDRAGSSFYPSDTTPVAAGGAAPDGIINNTDESRTEDRVAKVGEGISLRYTGIPRTALYNDFEFEQTRNWLGEDRTSVRGQSAPSAGEIFSRETITRIMRGIWTIGGQWMPCALFNMTSHVRYDRNNNDYDDKFETDSTATGAKSAFMEGLSISRKELATRMTFKPRKWLRPSVRYQYQMRDYRSRVESQVDVQTEMDSHTFVFEVALQPKSNLLIISSLSPQYAWVETPARYSDNPGIPRFQSNVVTWLNSISYDFTERLGLTTGFEHAVADNFNDFSSNGLPMAADYTQSSVFAAFRWKVNPWMTIEPRYDFYRYRANPLVESGNYQANLLWIKTILSWG